MASYRLPYGKASLEFNLPARWRVEMPRPRVVPAQPDPARAVQQALDELLLAGSGSRFVDERSADAALPCPLADLQGVRSVAIAGLLTLVASMDEALAHALRDLPTNARIGIMPLANATIPVLRQSE